MNQTIILTFEDGRGCVRFALSSLSPTLRRVTPRAFPRCQICTAVGFKDSCPACLVVQSVALVRVPWLTGRGSCLVACSKTQ
jgi:hypothetical protein